MSRDPGEIRAKIQAKAPILHRIYEKERSICPQYILREVNSSLSAIQNVSAGIDQAQARELLRIMVRI